MLESWAKKKVQIHLTSHSHSVHSIRSACSVQPGYITRAFLQLYDVITGNLHWFFLLVFHRNLMYFLSVFKTQYFVPLCIVLAFVLALFFLRSIFHFYKKNLIETKYTIFFLKKATGCKCHFSNLQLRSWYFVTVWYFSKFFLYWFSTVVTVSCFGLL